MQKARVLAGYPRAPSASWAISWALAALRRDASCWGSLACTTRNIAHRGNGRWATAPQRSDEKQPRRLDGEQVERRGSGACQAKTLYVSPRAPLEGSLEALRLRLDQSGLLALNRQVQSRVLLLFFFAA